MRNLIRTAAALTAGIAAVPASAQDVPQVISPLRVESDQNGVNLVNGKIIFEGPSLSAPGAGHLKFDRVQNLAPYVKGKVNSTSGAEYRTSNYSVHTGLGASDSFKCFDFDCTAVAGTGSTFLENARTYRQAGTGAVWHFNVQHVHTTGSPITIMYYASSVAFPNGESLSYSYGPGYLPGDTFNRTWRRPIQVTSSLGYHITISYQYTGTDVTNPLWASPSVATLYKTGDPTPIGQLTFSGSTITDLGGRIYSCTGCTNGVGADLETNIGSLQLPGEGSPALSATPHGSFQIVSSVTKDGIGWSYSYTNLRRDVQSQADLYDKLTVTGPNGYNAVYDLAAQGEPGGKRNVIYRSTDSIGRHTNYVHDEGYRPTQVTLHEGNKVEVAYDERGNLFWKRTTPKPSVGGTPIVEQAYFGDTLNCTGVMCWRPTWSRDGLNRQTDYAYNSAGQLIEQTDPADPNGMRRKTYITYEASTGISRKSVVRVCGDITTCGTANEARTEYQYWGSTFLPTLERKIDAARGITLDTTYSYDSAGRLLSTDGPLPGTDDAAYNRYDVHGRKIWQIGPRAPNGLRLAKYFTYRSADDKLVSTEEGTITDPSNPVLTALSRTDVAYDSRRNPELEWLSSGGITYTLVQRSFQNSGRVECETRRMNPAAFASLPANACDLGQPGSFGRDRITRNYYDAAGQLLQVQRAYGIIGLQQNYATYEYSFNGKQKAVTDANGNRAEMTYDGFDRPKRWIFPSNTPGVANQADYEEYGYNDAGNRTTLRKRDGVIIGYTYDNLNRVTQKSVPATVSGAAGYNVFYGYDVQGLQLYARFGSASGPGVTNAYDNIGRQISSATNMDGIQRVFTYALNARGNRTLITGGSGYYAGYDYDAIGRMTTVREGGGAIVAQLGYEPGGKRSSLGLGTGGAVTSAAGYGYDAVARLQSLTRDLAGSGADESRTFAYNPAAQIVTRTLSNDAFAPTSAYNVSRAYSVNGLNQYTTAGPAAFLYDANGNLRSDGSTSFVYDAENRLVSASGLKNATLAYDPLGRLWQVSSGGATTRFVYDGDKLVEEYNGSGTWQRAYIHGPGADEPLVWYDFTAGFDRRFFHADQQGSVVALADLYGNATAINGYDPWGIPNANNAGRFQYTGQSWLAELGMYYYKARMYSPTLGRFMQTDPIGYDDQINLYAYVGNDPINGTDPTGMAGCDRSLTTDQCNQAMAAQRVALQRVQAVRADIRHLREQRSDRTPGIDARAKATETALRSHFGSSLNSVLRAVDRNLANVETFLRDPGSAAGGSFDYRALTAKEISQGAGAGIGVHNRGYRPNTVALNILPTDSTVEILRTFVHEPLHVFGVGRPSIGEQYRGSAMALARVRNGTADAVYNNPDNYACLVFSGC